MYNVYVYTLCPPSFLFFGTIADRRCTYYYENKWADTALSKTRRVDQFFNYTRVSVYVMVWTKVIVISA